MDTLLIGELPSLDHAPTFAEPFETSGTYLPKPSVKLGAVITAINIS